MSHYHSTWDSSVWAWTLGSLGLVSVLLVVVLLRARTSHTISLVTAAILILPLMLVVPFAPRGFEISGSTLRIKTLLTSFRYDLRKVRGATIASPAAVFSGGTWRAFGVGGLFGYYGYFNSPQFGYLLAFVTNTEKLVMLPFPARVLVISPDRPQEFLREVQSVSH